jgi:hypothetical protein
MMAKEQQVPAAAAEIRHARLESPEEDYHPLKRASNSNGVILTAHETLAILRQIRIDEEEDGGR